MLICKHCAQERKNLNSLRNHERLCKQNPNRQSTPFMDGRQTGHKATNQFIKARDLGIDIPVSKCKGAPGTPHTDETKNKLSTAAKNRKLGGYKEGAGRSKKYKVIDSYGNETTLQSSYELMCSKILDNLNIKWTRPKALPYGSKNYFADFYLPEFDIWLDPKNDYKAMQDKEKIKQVILENNIKLYVLLKNQITHDYIKKLCS